MCDDVDRLGQAHDRVADELARAVPRDLSAAIHVDDGRAVGRALVPRGARYRRCTPARARGAGGCRAGRPPRPRHGFGAAAPIRRGRGRSPAREADGLDVEHRAPRSSRLSVLRPTLRHRQRRLRTWGDAQTRGSAGPRLPRGRRSPRPRASSSSSGASTPPRSATSPRAPASAARASSTTSGRSPPSSGPGSTSVSLRSRDG